MGAEKQLMIQLNAAVQGKPFAVPPLGSTVNMKGLSCAIKLFDAQRRGKPEMIAGAAREFRDFVEQQVGVLAVGRNGTDTYPTRKSACGLYALRPVKAGLVRAECRTTSHCHLHYAWLGAGLWASREYRQRADGLRHELELHALSDALLDWLHQELSWSSVCYVEGVGVLAPNRRHRRGKTHEIVLTSPDRDNLYRAFSGPESSVPVDETYFRQAKKPENVQQLGFRTIYGLLMGGDPGVGAVADAVAADQLQMPVFWDRLEVARRGNELVACVIDMERKGRDDTSFIQCGEGPAHPIAIDPPVTHQLSPAGDWRFTTFYAHDDKEVA